MTIRPLLVVLNPRRIPLCVESLAALPTARAWLRGWNETEIETEAWPVLMRDARKKRFTHLVVVSDDARVPLGAWQDVLRVAERGHPVTTGYCNLDLNRGFDITNMVSSPLPLHPIDQGDMEFYALPDLLSWNEDEIPTSFHGYALACMTWEIAEAFPFACYRSDEGDSGYSSDFHHSRRLADAGVDIVCARDGFILHVKERWSAGDEAAEKQLVHLKAKVRKVIWD